MTKDENEKKVEQVVLYARIHATADIATDFDHLFDVLYLVDKDATIQKRDVINILRTFKEYQIFKAEKAGICNRKGEPI